MQTGFPVIYFQLSVHNQLSEAPIALSESEMPTSFALGVMESFSRRSFLKTFRVNTDVAVTPTTIPIC